jgi:pimeloyl-ACP methyl ester carboxylesterase
LGDGEIPLVFVPGWVSNVDLYDDPAYPFAPLIEQLAQQTRLILWDKRGTGLSDPVNRVPTLDERMDDLHARARLGWCRLSITSRHFRGWADEHSVRGDIS